MGDEGPSNEDLMVTHLTFPLVLISVSRRNSEQNNNDPKIIFLSSMYPLQNAVCIEIPNNLLHVSQLSFEESIFSFFILVR